MQQIFEGCEEFIGIRPLILQFIELENEQIEKECEEIGADVREQVIRTMNYLCDLSNGTLRTNARILREFVMNHEDYKKDSIVTEVNFFFF